LICINSSAFLARVNSPAIVELSSGIGGRTARPAGQAALDRMRRRSGSETCVHFSVQSFGEAPATDDLPIPVPAAAAHPNATPDSVATAVVFPRLTPRRRSPWNIRGPETDPGHSRSATPQRMHPRQSSHSTIPRHYKSVDSGGSSRSPVLLPQSITQISASRTRLLAQHLCAVFNWPYSRFVLN
jgi:hypothetical protein